MALSLPDKPLSSPARPRAIGEAIARRLANAGAAVAVADLNLDGATKSRAVHRRRGISTPNRYRALRAVNAAIASVIEKRGQIDVLVNNAGIAGKARAAMGAIRRGLDVGHRRQPAGRGLLHARRPASMRKRKYGRVVNNRFHRR